MRFWMAHAAAHARAFRRKPSHAGLRFFRFFPITGRWGVEWLYNQKDNSCPVFLVFVNQSLQFQPW
jgi:hypothetical protein